MIKQSGGVDSGMAGHERNLKELINRGKSDTVLDTVLTFVNRSPLSHRSRVRTPWLKTDGYAF